MSDATTPAASARLIHLVTLDCKDAAHADRCLAAPRRFGRPDAESLGRLGYEFGLRQGSEETVQLVERWRRREDLDALLAAKVVPALPTYDELLKRPSDPALDTVRVRLSG